MNRNLDPVYELEPVIAAGGHVPRRIRQQRSRKSPEANILEWLLNGNLPAKTGILLLFIGLSLSAEIQYRK